MAVDNFVLGGVVILCLITMSLSLVPSTNIDDTLVVDGLLLDVPVDDDIKFAAEALRIPSVGNAPDYVTFIGNTQVLAFDGSLIENVFFSAQLPHSRKANTPLKPHFHTSMVENATGSAVFCLEYTCTDILEYFPHDVDFRCAEVTFDNEAYLHNYDFTEPIINTLDRSAMCTFRLFRNVSDARDTLTEDVILLEVDIHISKDKLGENFNPST